MRSFFPENVSDYSREQCQQYLAQYPNSMLAESVRERLDMLSKAQGGMTFTKYAKNDVTIQKPVDGLGNTGELAGAKVESQKTENSTAKTVIFVIVGLVVFVGLFLLAMGLWEWILGAFPVIGVVLLVVGLISNFVSKK